MKRKAAILYSGQPRSIKDCWQNHYDTLIKPNPEFEIDIIAHFWWDDDLDGTQIKEIQSGKKSKWDKASIDFFKDKWKPRKIILEKPKHFEDYGVTRESVPQPPLFNDIQHVLGMFYSIEQANDLKKIVEEKNDFVYDTVIRLRTDVFFDGDPIELSKLDNDTLYVEEVNCHKHTQDGELLRSSDYAVNDIWGIGNSEIMNKYSETFLNYRNLLERNCTINAECFLGFNLTKIHNVKVKPYGIEDVWLMSGINDNHEVKFEIKSMKTWIARHDFTPGEVYIRHPLSDIAESLRKEAGIKSKIEKLKRTFK